MSGVSNNKIHEQIPGNPAPAVLHLHQAEVRRQGRTVLTDVTFSLHHGHSLMILGPNGAGKSTFLALLRGDIWPVSPNGRTTSRQFLVQGKWQTSPLGWKERTALISPELELLYRRLGPLTCAQVIAAGVQNSLRPLRALSSEERSSVLEWAEQLGLTDLLPRPFAALSQGEAQKALLARALMGPKALLFWDELGTGLDREARERVVALLPSLTAKGVQLIVTTHRPYDVAEHMHHAVHLEHGRLHGPFPARGFHSPPLSFRQRQRIGAGQGGGKEQSTVPQNAPIRLRLDQVSLFIQGNRILGPVSWTLRAGDHWLIQGPNGSGKTTLLKLLAGELHPSRGSLIRYPPMYSQTLQGLRQLYGYFSPDLLTAHQRPQTGLQTVLSGLRGQLGHRDKFTRPEEKRALAWMRTLNIEELAGTDIMSLSSGQLRRVLLARALVHSPKLLLVDEPCAGLDAESRMDFLSLLNRLAQQEVQMVMVTHRAEDAFSALNRIAFLDKGRIHPQSLETDNKEW